VRPASRTMDNSQNFDSREFDAVGHNIRRARNHKFSSPSPASGTANLRKIAKRVDRTQNQFSLAIGGVEARL